MISELVLTIERGMAASMIEAVIPQIIVWIG
jgi:hypothetical protein